MLVLRALLLSVGVSALLTLPSGTPKLAALSKKALTVASSTAFIWPCLAKTVPAGSIEEQALLLWRPGAKPCTVLAVFN